MTVNCNLVARNSFLNQISFLFSSFLNRILTVLVMGSSKFVMLSMCMQILLKRALSMHVFWFAKLSDPLKIWMVPFLWFGEWSIFHCWLFTDKCLVIFTLELDSSKTTKEALHCPDIRLMDIALLLLVFWIQIQHFQVSNNTRLISLHNLQNCKQDKTRRAVNWASLQSNTRRNESSPKSRNLVSHCKEDFLQ